MSFKTGDILPRRIEHGWWCILPLCKSCHQTGLDSIHAVGEDRFFRGFGRGEGHGARLAATYLARYVATLETGTPMW